MHACLVCTAPCGPPPPLLAALSRKFSPGCPALAALLADRTLFYTLQMLVRIFISCPADMLWGVPEERLFLMWRHASSLPGTTQGRINAKVWQQGAAIRA